MMIWIKVKNSSFKCWSKIKSISHHKMWLVVQCLIASAWWKKRVFQCLLLANVQEQLAIKAASACNGTINPASASAWLLLFLLPTFYCAFYTLLQHWLEATYVNVRLFFKDNRDKKVASLCWHTELVFLLLMKSLAFSASFQSLACPIICHTTLLKSISVLVPSALSQFGSRWFYKAILTLHMLVFHSFIPA